MNSCENQRERLSEKSTSVLVPEDEAYFLHAIFEIYRNPPQGVRDLPCALERTEGLLSAELTAVRKRGDSYSQPVLSAIEKRDPEAAKLLRNAVIESDGHITFK